MYEGIIYKYTSPEGKSYIGQTTRPTVRRYEHWRQASPDWNCLFHEAIDKFGWENFSYEELCTMKCKNQIVLKRQLRLEEARMITKYNTKYPNGYNKSL